jgi:hypothetical protein
MGQKRLAIKEEGKANYLDRIIGKPVPLNNHERVSGPPPEASLCPLAEVAVGSNCHFGNSFGEPATT